MSKKEEQAQNIFKRFWGELEKLWKEEPKERALSMGDIYRRIWDVIEVKYPMAYLHDVFAEESNTLFAILSQDGKLYRSEITVTDNEIDLSEWIPVVMEFRPIEMRTKTHIIRQADGRVRWVSISATSVLNRVGEIDSRELIDSFIAYAEATREYPYRTFYHQGEQFRTGQGDFLARDGYCYITSGLYDDSEIARAEQQAIEKEPDYWGESIQYQATSDPQLLDISGIKIPVYRTGIHKEISTLPEKEAANLFTLVRMEVQRMLTGKALEAFVKLMGSEEKARKWLEENTDPTNRAIDETGMIARSQGDPQGEPAPEQEPAAVEIDDALLSEIVKRATESESFTGFGQQLNEITGAIQAVIQAQEALSQALEAHQTDVTTRLAKLERGKVAERTEWANDLPAKPNVTRVTLKSRFEQPPAEEDQTSTAIAEKTLAKLPTY